MFTEGKPDEIGTRPQNILLKMPRTLCTGYEFHVFKFTVLPEMKCSS